MSEFLEARRDGDELSLIWHLAFERGLSCRAIARYLGLPRHRVQRKVHLLARSARCSGESRPDSRVAQGCS